MPKCRCCSPGGDENVMPTEESCRDSGVVDGSCYTDNEMVEEGGYEEEEGLVF